MEKIKSVKGYEERAIRSSKDDRVREIWVDNAKCLAIFGIIGVHASATALMTTPLGQAQWWIADVFAMSLRWAAPLFIVVSGYTLIHSESSLRARDFYFRRMAKIGVPMAFWCLAYHAHHLIGMYRRGETITPIQEIREILTGSPYVSVWFLYAILGLYIVTPAVSILSRHTTLNQYRAICAGAFFLASAQAIFNACFGPNTSPLLLTTFISYIPYYLAGDLIWRKGLDMRYPALYAATCVVFMAWCLHALATYLDIVWAVAFLDYNMPYSILLTLSVTMALKKFRYPALGRLTALMSRHTLGIYLIHPYIMKVLDTILPRPGDNNFVLISLMTILTGSLALPIVVMAKKVPGIRRIL